MAAPGVGADTSNDGGPSLGASEAGCRAGRRILPVAWTAAPDVSRAGSLRLTQL